MSTRIARTAAVLLVGLALAAEPALAQGRRDRGQGGQGGQRGQGGQGGQGQGRSAEPRGGGRAERGNGGGRQEAGPRAGRQDNGGGRRTERQPNIERQPRADVQQRADVQPRVQAQPGIDSRQRGEGRSRSDNRSRWDGQYGDTNRRAVPRPAPSYGDRSYYGNRSYRDGRSRVVVPQYRYYGGSGYRSYPRYSYVVPYGYRPYGYGPGWNLNLYFGRPYGRQIYGNTGYGYYAIDPGFAYGSLRIVDAPRYAQVFVDGYYAGEVDDYDGIFQSLNLAPGPHRIEIVVDESVPPIEFEVQIIPGETVTYHARF